MANGENGGGTAGNRQINANTGVTIGLVLAVVTVGGAAVYKAGEVITDLSYVKLYVNDLRTEIADMKRIVQRLDRQQGTATNK